ncbi:MAG: methyltransferase domain-containing protein, partial [Alphaproteobacteria bacterium]|nr:methyltransferase domain-containing protein [Alphaproteobacteria bacterium]
MDLKEEDILGDAIDRHWYYRSKAAALRRAVSGLAPRRLLDIGAGSGFFSRHLLAATPAESALCVDIGYPADRDDQVAGKPVRFRRDTGPTDCDLVLMMDVLEHVDDDRSLVRHYAGKVPAGAHFLVTVPAFSFLWSGHD